MLLSEDNRASDAVEGLYLLKLASKTPNIKNIL